MAKSKMESGHQFWDGGVYFAQKSTEKFEREVAGPFSQYISSSNLAISQNSLKTQSAFGQGIVEGRITQLIQKWMPVLYFALNLDYTIRFVS